MTRLDLKAGSARASVDLLGAELRCWNVGDHPLLWEPDASLWNGTAPVLFPVVGWLRDGIRVAGRHFPLGLHGFARSSRFRVAERQTDRVRLVLESDAATRALYPFPFVLSADYALDATSLRVELHVRNAGSGPMPYACGLHPGFRWPFAGGGKADYEILFDEREAAKVPVIAPSGLFTRDARRVPLDGRRLPLSDELLAREALCFLDAHSRGLRFAAPSGSGAAIDVRLEEFAHIALWSRPNAPFLCIEAWTGHGDFVDADGDLFAKPSMRHLPPGASARHAAQFSFSRPHHF